jgi:3-keto-5-aminohexanoate cleavage enzyme
MPADEHLLDILLAETRRVIPGATWTAAGIGRELGVACCQVVLGHPDVVLEAGAHRVGPAGERPAHDARHGARPATTIEARSMLNLNAH